VLTQECRKVCSQCGIEQGFDCFYKHKGGKFNLSAECKTCRSKRDKKYFRLNQDIVRERHRNYRLRHREELLRYQRAYHSRNPAIYRAKTQRRITAMRALPATLTSAEWERSLAYFEHTCAVCGRKSDALYALAQDHWNPLSKGGGFCANNVLPLCHAKRDGKGGCNNLKRDKPAEQWLIARYGEEKASAILKRIQDYFDSLPE
jgi:hypothetical protein